MGVLPGLRMCWALSPEPGYYRDGEFGIRIEDVVLVVEAQTKVPLSPPPGLCMGPGGSDTAMGWQYHGGCTGQGEPHSPSDLPCSTLQGRSLS